MTRFFEDIRVGEQASLGSFVFEAEDIIRFARQFDPHPFHLDEEAARASHFGGLVASGWHTAAVWMRLMAAHWQRQLEIEAIAPGERRPRVGPSPGVTDLKWTRPVFAGDAITYTSRVTGKEGLASRPQWGLVISRNEGTNQKGELVIGFIGQVSVERRTVARYP